MPAKSKSQQRLFGMVHAYNKGELKGSKSMKKYIGSIAKGISDEDARHFAETSHKGLPEKKADDYKIEPYTGKYLDDKKLMSLVKLFKELDAEERIHDRPYGYRNLKEQLDLNYVKDWLKNKSSGYLASDKDNNIIGYGTNEYMPGEMSSFVSNLVINNKHRNKGIGRKILKRIIKDNIKRNLDTIVRVSLNNPGGIHLYSSVGFIPTGQTMLYRGQEKKSSLLETALQKLSADTAIGPRKELATPEKPFHGPNNIGQRVDLLRGVVGSESGQAVMNWFKPIDYTNAVLRANQSF